MKTVKCFGTEYYVSLEGCTITLSNVRNLKDKKTVGDYIPELYSLSKYTAIKDSEEHNPIVDSLRVAEYISGPHTSVISKHKKYLIYEILK